MGSDTLKGKTAIVTGGNRGIGLAIGIRLAADGASVALCARDSGLLDAAVRKIEGAGGRAIAIPTDLRLPDSAQRVIDRTIAAFGAIDILINNAGATKRGDFAALADEDWIDGFALKFFGTVRLTRAAWPHLTKQAGSVICISGSGGRTPGAQFAIGGSVNAALLSLTKALAETGLRDGIQVNAINPGPVRTARFDARLARVAAEHGVDIASAMAIFLREEKIARIAEPEDVAALVAFILGPNGRPMQGALIDMDCGTTKTI